MRYELYDVVRLTTALPEQGLPAGTLGVVVLVYDESAESPSYEIELCDDRGATLGLITIEGEALEPVQTAEKDGG